jgi:hypothetical protein
MIRQVGKALADARIGFALRIRLAAEALAESRTAAYGKSTTAY